jgi:hypothetical protein
MPRFAYACDDDAALAAKDDVHGLLERCVQARVQRPQGGDLYAEAAVRGCQDGAGSVG